MARLVAVYLLIMAVNRPLSFALLSASLLRGLLFRRKLVGWSLVGWSEGPQRGWHFADFADEP